MKAAAARLVTEFSGYAAALSFGIALGGWLACITLRRGRRIRRGHRHWLHLLERADVPMLLIDAGNRIDWCNRLAREAQRGVSPELPAAELAAAVRRCRLDAGSQEVRIDGRPWMLLVTPLLALRGCEAGASRRLVCLQDMERGELGRARAALRHIAHDLRTPLVSMLSLIDERAPAEGDTSGDEQRFLDELRRQTDYSLRISRDFLQLACAEQLDRAAFGRVDLEDVAVEAMDHLWLAAEQKSVQLIGPLCSAGDSCVQGNAPMLIRALANLIDNAIKYSTAGGRIRVCLQRHPRGRVRVQVVDEGCGIAGNELPHVFEPLFQGADHRARAQGVGLGLPFVKCVVERHGGAIALFSRPGRGTAARILLPLADTPRRDREPRPPCAD